MFIPKLGLVPLFATAALAAGLGAAAAGVPPAGVAVGAISEARSHDPFSWERATEKNKNT
jgi:hypothetical protein